MSKTLSAAEIRQSFCDFFQSKGHQIVPSSPVVLPADPTLLFVNAGMNQFKEIFLGARESAYRRVANSQKCIRVSGKHNDLEEVGHDTYHHTFFEMLGNWSFGDYYKRESLGWGWELLTKVWGLPKNRLWATVYKDDEEAIRIWREVTDIDPSHILRFAEKDNFWEMGETGPCGPCSEIHFDRTPNGCSPDQVNAGSPDVMEIWNHVFIQYNRRSDGTLEELPAKHVDTGMGLERITAVIQGKTSNYDTDVFMPVIQRVQALSGCPYEGEAAVAMRVIADHVRTLSFAIADGVLPSNEGRGYVLRRLLRRAARYGRKLGLTKPFLAELLPTLEAAMGKAYPELRERQRDVGRALQAEEESFATTLDRGTSLFEEVVTECRSRGASAFPGEQAFKLYDTYGFPYDLTALMAAEKKLGMDRERFDALMQEQRERGREARKASAAGHDADTVASLVAAGTRTAFSGYETTADQGEILAILRTTANGALAGGTLDALAEGETAAVVLSRTPFYPEKGGQVGDRGVLRGAAGVFEVSDTQQPAEGLIVHVGKLTQGRLLGGETVKAEVDAARRASTARHHTATHLLQWALRQTVSPSIKQAGSLVTPERLRFDFNYFEALAPEVLAQIERQVNELILACHPMRSYEMALKDVPGSGIIAIFDEKYGDQVRVADIAGYSRELCGGTHVRNTGEIGLFRIVSEGSIASGVRRIEAVCGLAAYDETGRERELVAQLTKRFSVAAADVPGRVDALVARIKELEAELRKRDAAAALSQAESLAGSAQDVAGVKLLAAVVGEQSADALKGMTDALMQRLGSGVVVLGGTTDGKAQFIAAVSQDWVAKGLHAGKLLKEVAKVAGGGGGGQPAMARAGGRDVAKIEDAIRQAAVILPGMVKA